MSLVDQLIQVDVKEVTTLKRGTFKSKRLAELLGKSEPIEVQIREIPQRRLNLLLANNFDKKGNPDLSNAFDTQINTIIEATLEPSMMDQKLQAHFQCENNAERLTEIIFGREVTELSDKIMELSGITEDTEEEVKNS